MAPKLILTVLTLVSIASIEVHGDIRFFFLRPPIISGEIAYPGQFPWQVILKKDLKDQLLCGGSIISANWVLTAAHCTYKRSSVVVSFGTVRRDDLSNYQIVGPSGIFVNPKYNPNLLSNDVSLINLPKSLVFNSYVQPIRLLRSSSPLAGQIATIIGFGVMDDDDLDYSEYLKYGSMVIRDNSVCEAIYNDGYVTSNNICAEPFSGNQNICSGDSGGPLVIHDAQGPIQVGINSFVVEEECTAGYPSVFVRITSFIDYINEITGSSRNATLT